MQIVSQDQAQGNREPRGALIIRRTIEAIAKSGLNIAKFGSRVAENYMATIDPADRTMEFVVAGSGSVEALTYAELRNREKVDHIIKGVVRFPVDLEEAWVASLPEPFRCDLVRELAKRYGLLGAKHGDLTAGALLANLADVLSDAGQTAVALAPLFLDGKIDDADRPNVPRALAAIERSLADMTSVREQLRAQMPAPAKPSKASRRR